MTGIGAGTGAVGTIAFGTIMGGAGSALAGGNFWQGAVTGLIVAGFNHLLHPGDSDDNGYDKNGKQINNNGGDKTDIMYNDDGSVYSTTKVIESGDRLADRGYGFKKYQIASGACSEDNSIFDWYSGGVVAKGIGSYILSNSGSLVLKYSNYLNKGNWWRLGLGPHNGQRIMRAAWGAHPNYLNQVPKALQGLNQWLRKIGGGHWDFPNWKP